MKNLLLSILLAFICLNTFEITAQNKIDSVSISKPQIKNIYAGLKQGEFYKQYYLECLQVSNELNQVINNQDQELKNSLKTITDLTASNEELNGKITKTEVDIQKLKNKKIPWYKHPILYLIVGAAGGVYIAK